MLSVGEKLVKNGHDVQYYGMHSDDQRFTNALNIYKSVKDYRNSRVIDNIINTLSSIYSIESKNDFTKLLNSFNPDIVHLHNYNYQLTPSVISAIKEYRRKGNVIKIIYTAHDS
ncbi:hypothetical protein AGMMS49992_18280 [Clostridia bacterium]|nr:hypothetical protein AGMMS49992_18280 [Clostridia bacterium]